MNNIEQRRVVPSNHPVYIHVHDVLQTLRTHDGRLRSTNYVIHLLVKRTGMACGRLRKIFKHVRDSAPFEHVIASVGLGNKVVIRPEDVAMITDEDFETYEHRLGLLWCYGPILQDDNPQQPTLTTAFVREINRRVRIPLLSSHQSDAVREAIRGTPVAITIPGFLCPQHITPEAGGGCSSQWSGERISLVDMRRVRSICDASGMSISPMVAERISRRLASAYAAERADGISDEQRQRERIRKEVAKLPIKRIKELQAEQDEINLYEEECADRAEKRREHRTLTIYQDEFFVYQEAVGNYLLHLSGSWREKPTGEGCENECFVTKKLGTGFKREWLPTDYLLEGCNEIQPERVPEKWLTAWSGYWKRELKRNGQW